MLKNNDQFDYLVNYYLVMMAQYHMHYHNDHHDMLVNKIVAVEVQYRFQLIMHNVRMILDYYYLFQILENLDVIVKMSLYQIQYQIPKKKTILINSHHGFFSSSSSS